MKPAILMSAPNGARRGKTDHPMLPVTPVEIGHVAREVFDAGASVLHLHVRDDQGLHSLDPGRYREAIAEVTALVPEMIIQVTTEAAGLFNTETQIASIRSLRPQSASVALRELEPDKNPDTLAFLHWMADQGIHTQHILYSTADITRFRALLPQLPQQQQHVIFVLGQYQPERLAEAREVGEMLVASRGLDLNWSLCAFGRHEHDCMVEAINLGGHGRIGFENNLLRKDGTRAFSNSDLVKDVANAISHPIATPQETREIWNL